MGCLTEGWVSEVGSWVSSWVSQMGSWVSDLGNGGVGQRSGDLGNWGNGLDGKWLTVDNGVESIDWIGGVLNDATGAIGLNQGVRSSHNISGAGLLLFLVVSGQGILEENGSLSSQYESLSTFDTYGNVVAITVLRVGIVIGNDGLGHNWGSNSNLGYSDRWVSQVGSWIANGDGVGDGHDGGEDGELFKIKK